MSAASTSAPAPLPRWLAVLPLLAAAAVFLPTLGGGFLADDFVYVARFHALPWSDWPRLFLREWSEGIWGFQLKELRPFAALSFMVDAKLWGGNALGFRLTNLALHVAATALVLRLAWRHGRGSVTAACIAAFGFALHPAHGEPVAWITGRVDLLGTVCALGFWIAAERWTSQGNRSQLALAGAAFFTGVFAKELCLFAPPLLLLHWLLVDPRVDREIWKRRLSVLIVVACVIGAYALCRRAAFGTDATTAAGGWADDDAWRRQASYLGWLAPVLPFHEQKEWTAPLAPAVMRTLWLAFAGVTIGGIAVALKRRATAAAEVLFFTGVWYLVTVGGFLLVSYFTPRHLYFPTAGLAIGAGLVVAACCRTKQLRTAIGILVVGWCAAAHVFAVRSWREAGILSREITIGLDRSFESAPVGTLALVSVPEVIGVAYVWAWGSPHALARPFVQRPVPATDVVERAGNYYRPDHWGADRQPVERVRTAPAAVVLVVDRERGVRQRTVPPGELQAKAGALAAVAQDGITPEEWTAWITTLLEP
ncbi:MAG TPA: hypothetical protein VHO24_05625 [Opitutaceae bacterium]|nr:hypothetical protein [Opitutaceae bacterium]